MFEKISKVVSLCITSPNYINQISKPPMIKSNEIKCEECGKEIDSESARIFQFIVFRSSVGTLTYVDARWRELSWQEWNEQEKKSWLKEGLKEERILCSFCAKQFHDCIKEKDEKFFRLNLLGGIIIISILHIVLLSIVIKLIL
ncbi:MAG: hypothetical protein ACMUIU_18790 [bacterium]